MEAKSTFFDQVKSRQFKDQKLYNLRVKVLQGEAREAILDNERVLRIWGSLGMPYMGNFIFTILVEYHKSKYSIHLRATKMYRDFRKDYWWRKMIYDIANFVTKC